MGAVGKLANGNACSNPQHPAGQVVEATVGAVGGPSDPSRRGDPVRPSTASMGHDRVGADASAPTRGVEAEVRMHSALTRYTVQQLRLAGVSQEDVAKHTGVSLRTIRRIEAEPPIDDPCDAALASRKKLGRPSKTSRFRLFVENELDKQDDLLTLELLRRARTRGYEGGKSAFFEMVRDVRKPACDFTSRFEGIAGEFTQHDFGTVTVTFVDGTKRRVKFFASRLKWSRFAAVTIVPDETAETLVRTLLEHFVELGGVPTLAVFDRPKTVAVTWEKDGKITQWNETFAQAAMDIGFAAHVCWPYSPNQKGSVERIVGWVKTSFFKQRRFHDMADLEAQLAEWLHDANYKRKSRATGVIPESRRREELPRLRSPRVSPDELALRRPISIGPTAYIAFEGHEYAVEPELAGKDGTMFVHGDRIRIVVGGRETVYVRNPRDQKRSTGARQRVAQLRALSSRGKKYQRRQHLLDLGASAEQFLTELCHREPDWAAAVELLHVLLEQHGDDAMRRCFRVAADIGRYDVAYIAELFGEPQGVAAK